MSILVSGSIAYDTICRYDGLFRDFMLPSSIDRLNLTFLAAEKHTAFGGCAPNIAWSLKLLGESPLIFSAVGHDGGHYLEHLRSAGLDTGAIRQFPDEWTAQVFITTDRAGNQLATFHPGAMARSAELELPAELPGLVHIAPGWAGGMVHLGALCAQNGIPMVFDPGQAISQIPPEQLLRLSEQATLICLSEYEAGLFQSRLGRPPEDFVSNARTLLITYGEKGSSLLTPGRRIDIGAIPVNAKDPVGAGDAYRGGLLYAMARHLPWEVCGRLGAVMASFKLEHSGGHSYSPAPEDIRQRYRGAWKEDPPL